MIPFFSTTLQCKGLGLVLSPLLLHLQLTYCFDICLNRFMEVRHHSSTSSEILLPQRSCSVFGQRGKEASLISIFDPLMLLFKLLTLSYINYSRVLAPYSKTEGKLPHHKVDHHLEPSQCFSFVSCWLCAAVVCIVQSIVAIVSYSSLCIAIWGNY